MTVRAFATPVGSTYITGPTPPSAPLPRYDLASWVQNPMPPWVPQNWALDHPYGVTRSIPPVGQLWPRGRK